MLNLMGLSKDTDDLSFLKPLHNLNSLSLLWTHGFLIQVLIDGFFLIHVESRNVLSSLPDLPNLRSLFVANAFQKSFSFLTSSCPSLTNLTMIDNGPFIIPVDQIASACKQLNEFSLIYSYANSLAALKDLTNLQVLHLKDLRHPSDGRNLVSDLYRNPPPRLSRLILCGYNFAAPKRPGGGGAGIGQRLILHDIAALLNCCPKLLRLDLLQSHGLTPRFLNQCVKIKHHDQNVYYREEDLVHEEDEEPGADIPPHQPSSHSGSLSDRPPLQQPPITDYFRRMP